MRAGREVRNGRVISGPQLLGRLLSDPVLRTVVTAQGWSPDGARYRTQTVWVDADGVHPAGADDEVRVDLGAEQCARHVDLAVPEPGELGELRRHVVDDLLPLHDRRVTYTLLAAAALAVLYRSATGASRPALWLLGLTGTGKSFAAKLFANFFGEFPVDDGSRVGSWSSTANYLQRQGYYFKDAYYLIDDYKPEVARHAEVIKLLQNYADGSARGRLNADATTNVTRGVRGILVATGEAVPENTPSALARLVIVRVPGVEKDVERGRRCLARCGRYRALMAGFVHQVIKGRRGARFGARVHALRDEFYAPIIGAQNDLRIAANLALLGAAFEEFARFLRPAWPTWEREAAAFVGQDLAALRGEMVDAVRDQQPSEVFLATLRALIAAGRVRILGHVPSPELESALETKVTVGRRFPARSNLFTAVEVNATLALEAVQESLRRRCLPPLAVTERTLIDQLAGDGKLLDREGQPIDPKRGGGRTHDVNLGGRTVKVFRVAAGELIERYAEGGGPSGPDPGRPARREGRWSGPA
jgi:hypothetical protein